MPSAERAADATGVQGELSGCGSHGELRISWTPHTGVRMGEIGSSLENHPGCGKGQRPGSGLQGKAHLSQRSMTLNVRLTNVTLMVKSLPLGPAA